MILLLKFLTLTSIFIVVLKIAAVLVAEKPKLSREELTYYECGFESKSTSRIPFSFRYFLLTLIFLLFDLEILFLAIVPLNVFYSVAFFEVRVIMVFLLILVRGLAYE